MKNIKYILSAFVLVVITVVLYKVPITESQRLNKQCQDFGKGVIEQRKDLFDGNSKINFFYSKRLDTCVKQEIDELGNDYSLCDIKRNSKYTQFTIKKKCATL